METNNSILALDYGVRRIGLAIADTLARLPHPFSTLANDQHIWTKLDKIITAEHVSLCVVGLPRGLDGQETKQTEEARLFADTVHQKTKLPVYLQDEAGTSKQAEDELEKRSETVGKIPDKNKVDALAATYILEDYLKDNP